MVNVTITHIKNNCKGINESKEAKLIMESPYYSILPYERGFMKRVRW